MEAQLADYRARKRKQQRSQAGWFPSLRLQRNTSNEKLDAINASNGETKDEDILEEPRKDTLQQRISEEEDNCVITDRSESFLTVETTLKLLLWLMLLGAFVFLGLGAVFLLLSLFYLIYSTMDSGRRKDGQLSAYSVFNPNCERLQGQLTAEQFEKELKYGAGSM
ncbi:SAYSvFN domain-containing protein 1 [Holothuria leucospilota]|uniref:SAYSvFN domain-containing protein 1 n=1 Tax=Holothuria leucospilota TaxID=206669 RepID=A0A9Q1CJB3_HOLLE|nr:SAYSvFN domain-containing protein 1 [Holothuria leucospilota]